MRNEVNIQKNMEDMENMEDPFPYRLQKNYIEVMYQI
jgi:hypothetical protein